MRPAAEIMMDLAGAGLTPAQLALVMELSATVAAEARPSDTAAEKKRAYDREYRRVKRGKSRTMSYDTDDNNDPPIDNNHTPRSVSNDTGGPAADPVKELFDLGVSILTSTGTGEKQARSLLGKWRKAKGEAAVLQALLDCRARSISNPVEWIEARFKSAKYVSASGYEYRGTEEQILKEAERRGDNNTYWAVKTAMKTRAA